MMNDHNVVIGQRSKTIVGPEHHDVKTVVVHIDHHGGAHVEIKTTNRDGGKLKAWQDRQVNKNAQTDADQ